jgi:hypothetical protein
MKWLIIQARAPMGVGRDKIVSQLEAPDKPTARGRYEDLAARRLLPSGCCVVSEAEFEVLNTPVKDRRRPGGHRYGR